MTNEAKANIGVVAADSLRSMGLVAILEETAGVEAYPLKLDDVCTAEDLDLVLLDLQEPLDAILPTITHIRRERPSLKPVVMGEPLTPDQIQAVIGAGAKGFLLRSAGVSEISMAIEIVLDGSIWAPRKVLAKLVEAGTAGAESLLPAPAPQDTSSLLCSSDKPNLSEKKLANTAPACFGAPSRPSDAPMPTMITESTALPIVRQAGIRPAWNQIAAVVSIPLPLDRCFRMICPAPVTRPAPSRTRMCRHAPACWAASNMSVPFPPHIRRWTSSSNRVSAAAPMPVPIPVSTTANQKRMAPELVRAEGI